MTKLQAHRGVCSEYPENTLAAFKASVEQGYEIIEFDPKYTTSPRPKRTDTTNCSSWSWAQACAEGS